MSNVARTCKSAWCKAKLYYSNTGLPWQCFNYSTEECKRTFKTSLQNQSLVLGEKNMLWSPALAFISCRPRSYLSPGYLFASYGFLKSIKILKTAIYICVCYFLRHRPFHFLCKCASSRPAKRKHRGLIPFFAPYHFQQSFKSHSSWKRKFKLRTGKSSLVPIFAL